ncbi:MAG: Cytochrome c biogenesis protein [Parcubacteria group bacterium GW2011_GWC1_45_14]|nr:MAG: Cytochrome c biogenesis protein [Parcubacteria group bacterium GW2011_GWC1_45_14]
MKKILFVLSILFALSPFVSFAQEDAVQEGVVIQETKKEAVYFYSDSCQHCRNVDKFFTDKGFYDKYDIKKYSFDELQNKTLLSKILRDKGVQNVGIPALIIDEEIFLGDTPIIKDFERKMEASQGTASEFVAKFGKGRIDKPAEPKVSFKEKYGISLSVLTGAALVDAINPCAFAVLILLIATVLNAQGKKKALYSGLLFSLAIFVSYILMGLGVYSAITAFNLPQIISLVVGMLAVIIGLANLKDFFWYGKFFIMEVPFSWRPKMQTILKHVTSPFGALTAGFFAGFLVSLFLLPCTSGPYVVVLGLLAEKVEFAKTFTLLVYYNLIFVAPMIAITLAVSYFGVKAGKLENWRQQNLKLLHLLAGVIMTGIGIYLIATHI